MGMVEWKLDAHYMGGGGVRKRYSRGKEKWGSILGLLMY